MRSNHLVRLLRWLVSPVIKEDPVEQFQADFLNIIALVEIASVSVIMLGNLVFAKLPVSTMVIDAIILLTSILYQVWIRQGRVKLVAFALNITGFVLITAALISLGTIRTATTAYFLPFIIISVVVFGLRGLVASLVLSSGIIFVLTLAQQSGRLPPASHEATLSQWVIYVVLFLIIGMFIYYLLENQKKQLADTRREIEQRKQAEKMLESTKDRLEATLDALPDIMFRLDRHGTFLDCHPHDDSKFFIPMTEFLGKKVVDIFSPETTKIIMDALEDANKNGAHLGSEYSLPTPEGTGWYEHSIARVEGKTDEDNQFISLIRDITRRKRAELELREANAMLSQLATTDALTGVWNRRQIMEIADIELARCRRYGDAAAILLIDIDHFKSINDRFGHRTGDRVLVELCQIIRGSLRSADLLGRWGGEEFLVVAPHSSGEEALVLAERLRAVLAGHSFGEAGTITASFGVAELLPDETQDSWFRRADAALYQSKEAGRNSVRLAEAGSANQ